MTAAVAISCAPCHRAGARFGLVQKARLAGVVGIVVGTLSAAKYGAVIHRLQALIKDAGMQVVVVVV